VIERDAEWIIRTMSTRGLRITEQRRTLARLFADAQGFLTPLEVYSELVSKHPGLSFDTVYRNLRTLHEMGVLEPFYIEDTIKFRIGCHDHNHHHHLICLDCSQMFPLEFCPMNSLKVPDSFQIVKHRFEVYGYCFDCKKQEKPKLSATISA
jgi:Fur family zinc uptake transcriptional regulator